MPTKFGVKFQRELKLATGSCYWIGLSKDDDGGCRRVQFHWAFGGKHFKAS